MKAFQNIFRKISLVFILLTSFLINQTVVTAQESRAQYPLMLKNAYFGVNIGYINYPFSDEHLAPGYTTEKITIPHTAVRIIPFGYRFSNFLSAQISYMRPVLWVRYYNVNGDGGNHAAFMNVGGVTLLGNLPLNEKLNLYGEGGFALVTRKGFHYGLDSRPRIMENAVIPTTIWGGGVKYSPNNKWDFQLSACYSPSNSNQKQPHTVFYSGGFNFNMGPLPEETVTRNENSPYAFPRNMLQIGYTTNRLGYGVNNFFSEGAVPVFWGGYAEIKEGFSIMYQRNAFHTYRSFSLDWGVSWSYWVSDVEQEKFWTLAIFPVLRFNLVRTKLADLYFNYSLAGPCYISGETIDNRATGPHFTFQDFMGIGGYFGTKKNINFDIRIAHYSNGNLFPYNEGVKIPLTFSLGYAWGE